MLRHLVLGLGAAALIATALRPEDARTPGPAAQAITARTTVVTAIAPPTAARSARCSFANCERRPHHSSDVNERVITAGPR